jgi:hypothetical protein
MSQALKLDSSQNATFAGNVQIKKAGNALDVRKTNTADAVWTATFCDDDQAPVAARSHDHVLIQSADVPSLRIHEYGANQSLGVAVGDGNATIASTETLRFFVNGSHTGSPYSGMSGTQCLIFATDGTATFAGNVGIGDSPSYRLDVQPAPDGISAMFRGDSSNSYFAISSDQSSDSAGFKIVRSDSATSLTFNGHNMNGTIGGTWTENSDERLKENVETIEDALSKVKGLRGVSYTLKDATDYDFDAEAKHIGFIAQECEEILPEVVHTSDDEDGLKSISYSQITSVLVEAIKELSAKVEALDNA